MLCFEEKAAFPFGVVTGFETNRIKTKKLQSRLQMSLLNKTSEENNATLFFFSDLEKYLYF